MGNDTPGIGDEPSSTNNDPFLAEESHIIPDAPSSTNNDPSVKSHIIPDAPSSTNNDPSAESHIIPDAPSSTNNDPSAESHIIPDAPSSTNNDPSSAKSHIISNAPCSGNFSKNHKLQAKRKQFESLFDTKKQELLRKVQLLYKKKRKLEAKRQKLESSFDNKIQKLEAERNRLESVTKLLFNDDQRRYLIRGNTRGVPWSKATIQLGLKLRNACGIKGYSLLRDIGLPFPCECILQQKIENMKMQPGILEFADTLQTKISYE